jgi:hypothetical protein
MPAAHTDIVVNGNFDADAPSGGTAPAGWTLTNAATGPDFFVESRAIGWSAVSAQFRQLRRHGKH